MSQSESSRKHYLAHRNERIADKRERRRKVGRFVQAYKASRSCKRCGEATPCCLDFHHRDPKQKVGNIPTLVSAGWSVTHLLTEIEKCDILCANCHRKETFLGV